MECTAGICSLAAVLIAYTCYLSQEAEASQGFSPTEHSCVGLTRVLLRRDRGRTGSSGNVGAGAWCTVTLAPLCSNGGHVGFTAQEVCQGARSSS